MGTDPAQFKDICVHVLAIGHPHTQMYNRPVLRIRMSFNADPDPAFLPNADPVPDPGFFDTLNRGKNFKTFFKKFFHF